MKKLTLALVVASVSAVSIPSFSMDWLYQQEQTRRFQKQAAAKRAAKAREAETTKSGSEVSKPEADTAKPATRDANDSAEKRSTTSGASQK